MCLQFDDTDKNTRCFYVSNWLDPKVLRLNIIYEYIIRIFLCDINI